MRPTWATGAAVLPLMLAAQEAPPAITPGAIVNAASLMPASLPGGVLPRGGLFAMFGPRVGVLDGEVIVTIHRDGLSWRAVNVFVSETEVTARVPVEIPPGDAAVTVTYRNQTSVPHPIRIADEAPGILAVRSEPTCSGVSSRLDRRVAVADGSTLMPGGTAWIWATGVGAAPKIRVGGHRTRVIRLDQDVCVPGLQRIEVRVPPNTPHGCAVPVLIVGGNAVPIGVAPKNQSCRDPETWLADLRSEQPVGFALVLDAHMRLLGKGRTAQDAFIHGAAANFGVVLAPPGKDTKLWPPEGTCGTWSGISAIGALLRGEPLGGNTIDLNSIVSTVPRGPTLDIEYPRFEQRDAGPALTIRGQAGARVIPRHPRYGRFYVDKLGGSDARPFFSPGRYELVGGGGTDVGPFSLPFEMPAPVDWTNRDRFDEVDRRRPVTLHWRASSAQSAAMVFAAGVDSRNGASTLCICIPGTQATSFTVPPEMLANIPASRSEDASFLSQLGVVAVPRGVPASARANGTGGIYVVPLSVSSRSVRYR